MKKALELDFSDLVDILEGFSLKLDKMSEADLIDLAARLKPIVKHCTKIDEHVKDVVKQKLNNKAGSRLGGLFRAVLSIVPTDRLNQQRLKEERPKIYDAYVETDDVKRITFEVR
jgi:hypothetical protein